MVRETPLNLAHLRNMTAVTEMGGIVIRRCRPLSPARTIDALVADTVERVLGLLGAGEPARWNGGAAPSSP